MSNRPTMPSDEVCVAVLFTTFPVVSETFLQRELRVFMQNGLPVKIFSLWKGAANWEGFPVERFGIGGILQGLLMTPIWLMRRPEVVTGLMRLLWRPRHSGWLNWGENLLGFLFAMARSRAICNLDITHLHAVWGSAPAMAGLVAHHLTAIPFSFGAHAYDLFEFGGDGWIREKAAAARFVRTSTITGQQRLLELSVPPVKILMIRRGLDVLPEFDGSVRSDFPPRFISVGRMVEKMGFIQQIPLIQKLAASRTDISVEWIGDGPERHRLEAAVQEAGLQDVITFRGRLDYDAVELAYQRNSFYLFTGIVDRHGDRAGLPNAVAEAMAWGLVVFATDVGATREAIVNSETGILWAGPPDPDVVLAILEDPVRQDRIRRNARAWIERHYLLRDNLRPLIERLSDVTFSS